MKMTKPGAAWAVDKAVSSRTVARSWIASDLVISVLATYTRAISEKKIFYEIVDLLCSAGNCSCGQWVPRRTLVP